MRNKRKSYHPEYYADDRYRSLRDDDDMPPANYVSEDISLPDHLRKDRYIDGADAWVPAVRTGWSTGEVVSKKIAEDCSWCDAQPKVENVIILNKKVTEAIMWLMENKGVEWQMLLVGEVSTFGDDGDVITISDYIIPKQVVSGATVKNVDCIDKQFIDENKIVCTIHSHVSMGAFFSSTDVTECNSGPIKYHIVMNNKYQYESVKQIKLACGLLKFIPCSVVLWSPKPQEPQGVENIEGGC